MTTYPARARPVRRTTALLLVGCIVAALGVIGPAAAGLGLVAGPAPARPGVASVDSAEERPLVIVLDTSGSMDEDDGTGTIKLAGAQAALSQVIREQRPGSRIGLWTYPSSDECEPGRFAIPVSRLDQRSMIATIKSLTAGGETPTGPALRSVVDELKEEGYQGATLLLISDGLHTCDPEPCAVARQVVSEGFDLTVQAAGFKISTDGLRELRCIAQATGGQVFEAANAEQLGQVVTDAATAVLSMTVDGIPSRTPAGSASRVTVTVRNDSAVDVEDARVAIDFTRGAAQDAVVPSVLPPLVRIGRLHSGDSWSHEWVISYGSRGKTGQAGYRVAAWGRNASPVVKDGEVDVVDRHFSLADADGPVADLDGGRIAIIGDSYSAGEGAGGYVDGTSQNGYLGDNQCHQSLSTYLAPLFKDRVELVACSGATTHHLDPDDDNGVLEDQLPELEERLRDNGPVDAAFMTAGGNDIGFREIITRCVAGHARRVPVSVPGGHTVAVPTWDRRCSDDDTFVTEHDRLIADLKYSLGPLLRRTYDTLNTESVVEERDGRIAPLYVLAYPQPFPESQFAVFCLGFDAQEVAYANALVDRLDSAIEATVARVRNDGYDIRMIPTTQEAFLPDNTACPRFGAEPYIHPIDLPAGVLSTAYSKLTRDPRFQEFVHPTQHGYQVETDVILQWSTSAPSDDLPPGVSRWRVAPDPGWTDDLGPTIARYLTPPLPSAGTARFDATSGGWASDPLDVRGGQGFELEVQHAQPGSTVRITMAPREQVIGSIQVDDSGDGHGEVTVPRLTPTGRHELTLVSFDTDGNPRVATQDIDVARAVPMWLAPLAVLVLLSGPLGLLLGRRSRRRAHTVGTTGQEQAGSS